VISDGGWAPATEPPTDYQQQQQQPQQEELRGLSLCLSRWDKSSSCTGQLWVFAAADDDDDDGADIVAAESDDD